VVLVAVVVEVVAGGGGGGGGIRRSIVVRTLPSDVDDDPNSVCFSASYSTGPLPTSEMFDNTRSFLLPEVAPLVLTDDGAVVAPSMIRLASIGGGSQYVEIGGTVWAAKKLPIAAAALDAAVDGISDAERTFVDRERP
jgi:hypothetical protein